MRVVITYDPKEVHYDLIPEDNIDKASVDLVGATSVATVKRNGTLRFSIEPARVLLKSGKYDPSSGVPVNNIPMVVNVVNGGIEDEI